MSPLASPEGDNWYWRPSEKLCKRLNCGQIDIGSVHICLRGLTQISHPRLYYFHSAKLANVFNHCKLMTVRQDTFWSLVTPLNDWQPIFETLWRYLNEGWTDEYKRTVQENTFVPHVGIWCSAFTWINKTKQPSRLKDEEIGKNCFISPLRGIKNTHKILTVTM